ncbi:MAG: hypothetical protein WCI04_06210 [archaeon]
MYIQNDIEKLSTSEIEELIERLKNTVVQRQQKSIEQLNINKSSILIVDFFSKIPCSARLHNVLWGSWNIEEKPYIEDITKKEFLTKRNAGKNTWDELVNAINNSLIGTCYEKHQQLLQKHFFEQENLWQLEKKQRAEKRLLSKKK